MADAIQAEIEALDKGLSVSEPAKIIIVKTSLGDDEQECTSGSVSEFDCFFVQMVQMFVFFALFSDMMTLVKSNIYFRDTICILNVMLNYICPRYLLCHIFHDNMEMPAKSSRELQTLKHWLLNRHLMNHLFLQFNLIS